ncbi:superoxide dismutase [Longitalea luteola]|uniref:superoxide dismutase n=1 Tax=Longitalea luteola TaxID=2812563 RepID=UPI001F6073B6|nr:superoxide dismutase [Longitalea luteola]
MKKENTMSRRHFISNTGKAGLATVLTVPALLSMAAEESSFALGGDNNDIGWTQQPLGYDYKAIEPAIDAQTMEIHYTKHAASYAKNLAEAVKAEQVNTSSMRIEQLLQNISKYSAKMRNNAGGHYNHELFWKTLKAPAEGNNVSGKLKDLITRDFGSVEAFKNKFTEEAETRFGSGWAWLIYTRDKKLIVSSTPNQDNPLMSVADVKGLPVLGLDVWEHAYYLKYQNKRPEYINAWWNTINWDYVQKRFAQM